MQDGERFGFFGAATGRLNRRRDSLRQQSPRARDTVRRSYTRQESLCGLCMTSPPELVLVCFRGRAQFLGQYLLQQVLGVDLDKLAQLF